MFQLWLNIALFLAKRAGNTEFKPARAFSRQTSELRCHVDRQRTLSNATLCSSVFLGRNMCLKLEPKIVTELMLV